MLRGTVIPSGGVVHGGISAMTTLKQEPNEKPGDNPSHVSVDVDLKVNLLLFFFFFHFIDIFYYYSLIVI